MAKKEKDHLALLVALNALVDRWIEQSLHLDEVKAFLLVNIPIKNGCQRLSRGATVLALPFAACCLARHTL